MGRRGDSGPARAGDLLVAFRASVGFTYGYSRCLPFGQQRSAKKSGQKPHHKIKPPTYHLITCGTRVAGGVLRLR